MANRRIDFSVRELDEIIAMSESDPGMHDLLEKVKTYYLLKRPIKERYITVEDVIKKMKEKSLINKTTKQQKTFRGY